MGRSHWDHNCVLYDLYHFVDLDTVWTVVHLFELRCMIITTQHSKCYVRPSVHSQSHASCDGLNQPINHSIKTTYMPFIYSYCIRATTGSIARSEKRRHLSYSEGDFEVFHSAVQGRHVAPMGVKFGKFGTADSSVSNFTHNSATIRVQDRKLKILLKFLPNFGI